MLYTEALTRFHKNLLILDRSPQTVRGYMNELGLFQKYMQSRYNSQIYVEDITIQDLEEYMLYLKDKDLKPRSRARASYILRSYFKYLNNVNIIPKNPAALLGNIKITQQAERCYLAKDEALQLIGAIEHPIIKAIVSLLFYTGLRVSEATNLLLSREQQGSDVNIEDKLVKVVAGKGNKDRIVPFNDTLQAILIDYLENVRPQSKSNKFFLTKKTGSLSPQTVNRELKKAALKLGWTKDISAHITRHSYATLLLEKDVNIVQISKLLGHSSLKTTSVYAHTSMKNLRQAAEAL